MNEMNLSAQMKSSKQPNKMRMHEHVNSKYTTNKQQNNKYATKHSMKMLFEELIPC